MASQKAIDAARQTLSGFDNPEEVLRILQAHILRFGKNPPGLLAKILSSPKLVADHLREAASKADNQAMALKIRLLLRKHEERDGGAVA